GFFTALEVRVDSATRHLDTSRACCQSRSLSEYKSSPNATARGQWYTRRCLLENPNIHYFGFGLLNRVGPCSHKCSVNVRLWSLADICAAKSAVRFTPQ